MEVVQIIDNITKTEFVYVKHWELPVIIKQQSSNLELGTRNIYLDKEEAIALYQFLGEVLKGETEC